MYVVHQQRREGKLLQTSAEVLFVREIKVRDDEEETRSTHGKSHGRIPDVTSIHSPMESCHLEYNLFCTITDITRGEVRSARLDRHAWSSIQISKSLVKIKKDTNLARGIRRMATFHLCD